VRRERGCGTVGFGGGEDWGRVRRVQGRPGA
jgi:hypothetical protein